MKTSYYNTTQLNTLGVTALNDLGYPEGTLGSSLQFTTTMIPNAGSDIWCIDWVGTIGSGSIGLSINNAITINTGAAGAAGTVISGGAGGSAVIRGTNGYMEFTFVSMSTSINGWSASFQSGCVCSGITSLRIYRKAEKTALNSGSMFNTLFLGVLSPLKLGRLRMMSAFLNTGSERVTNANWNYRTALNARSFTDRRYYHSSAWAGAITNSGNLYTAGSYADMPVAYADGETFAGTISATSVIVTVASVGSSSGKIKLSVTVGTYANLADNDIIAYVGYTASGNLNTGVGMWRITKLASPEIELTTNYHTGAASVFATFSSSAGTITVTQMNAGSRGVRPVISDNIQFTNPIASSSGVCWFVYKKPLEAWVAHTGGIYQGFPVEAAVNLCNALNYHFWWNLTFFANDDFATNAITYIRDNLNSGLELVFEDSNEVWNFAFTQYFLYALSAAALGITSSAAGNVLNELSWSYQGLSLARRVDVIKPIWTASRPSAQLQPVLTNWAPNGFIAGFQSYKVNGGKLNAATNATLSAYTGGQSYNTGSPTFNRPGDRAVLLSVAAYININQTLYPLFPMAQEYATGSQQVALNSYDAAFRARVDNDIVAVGQFYEDLAASYDGARPPGMSNFTVEMYEGGHQVIFPKMSDYVTAGYTTTSTVTFDIANDKVLDATNNYVNGNRVSFTGGTLPTELTAGTEYLIVNANPGVDYQLAQISLAPLNLSTAMLLSGLPSGTITSTATTYSCDNLITAWLNDNRSAEWIKYFAAKFTNPAAFPHMKRVGFLNLAAWQQLVGTPAVWSLWSLYPTNIASTPLKTYSGVRDYNAAAR